MRMLICCVGAILLTGCSTTAVQEPVRPLPRPLAVGAPIVGRQDTLKALGVRVKPEGSPFLVLDKEPAFRVVSPYSPVAIVPVARLHERLNRMQIESLLADKPIVRYEVIDLEFKTQDIFYQFDESDDNGLRALALVYAATLKKDSVPLGPKRMVTEQLAGGRTEVAKLDKLTVTLYEFELKAIGIARSTEGNATIVDIGTEDWEVVSFERKASADASYMIGQMPVYDPSALAIVR